MMMAAERKDAKRDDARQEEKLRGTSKDYEYLRQRRHQLERMRGFVSNEASWLRQRHQVGDKIRKMERGLSDVDLQTLAEIAGRARVPRGTAVFPLFVQSDPMDHPPKYDLRIDNVYFLKHVGATLRQATAGVPREELPEDIRLALRRLERREFLQNILVRKP
jgi:hypothetical protein